MRQHFAGGEKGGGRDANDVRLVAVAAPVAGEKREHGGVVALEQGHAGGHGVAATQETALETVDGELSGLGVRREEERNLIVDVEGVVGEGGENGDALKPALVEGGDVVDGVLRRGGRGREFDEIHGEREAVREERRVRRTRTR